MKRLRLLLLVLAQVAGVLGLFEVGLRLAGPRLPRIGRMLQHSSVEHAYGNRGSLEELIAATPTGYRPRTIDAGFVLNSKGLRTHEYSRDKQPGVFRVVVLGDSFAFASGGVPYDDLWVQVLGRELEDSGVPDVEVINLGIPSVGPRFAERMWQLEGSRLNADLVVHAFFVGNDFTDDQSVGEELDDTGWLNRSARWSYLARFIRNGLRVRENRPAGRTAVSEREVLEVGGVVRPAYASRYPTLKPIFTEEAFLKIERRRSRICREDAEAEFERLLAGAVETLARLHAAVTAAGSEFVVMIIPDEFQVDDGLMTTVASRFGLSMDDYDLHRPQRRLAAELDHAGIRHVDLLEDFRRAAAERRLYRLRDTHWNPDGNRLAATLLVEALSDEPIEGLGVETDQ